MKKSISVNISGMLFNIEEDAYERLQQYLNEIKQYFGGFNSEQASDEIVADIENRIAEIFGTKVGPYKQVLTLADVESLIAQMGSIQDFAAADEVFEEPSTKQSRSYQARGETYQQTADQRESAYEGSGKSRRLYRDVNQKILGGVAAGIAHYLHIDPMWLRLILLTFVAFDIFLTFAISSSALIVGYIICWIALPERTDLKEDKKTKKMFRNPDDKVVAGVAGGLGAYFGLDPVAIRILFALAFILGGSGLLIYVILWICMPMAKTLTDRMQMQGEPVTLANIEEQIKKNINLKEGEEESLLARILLFPFRLLSAIFSGSGAGARTFLKFLLNTLRIAVGLAITLASFFAILGLLISAAVLAGAYQEGYISLFDMEAPIALLRNTVPDYVLIALLLVATIPLLFTFMLGIRLMTERWLMPKAGSWTLAGAWIIALVIAISMVPALVFNYQQSDYITSELALTRDQQANLVLKTSNGSWKSMKNVDLTIKGTPDSLLKLEKRIWGSGATQEEAKEHARWASYAVLQQGNTITFPNQLELPENKPFYAQHAKITLYIPYGQAFSMSHDMKRILYNTLSPWGYRTSDLTDNVFAFNQQGELECISCSEERQQEVKQAKAYSFVPNGRLLNHKDFDRLKVGSHYQFTVEQGDEYKVEVTGQDEALDQMEVEQRGSTLSFSEENMGSNWWKSSKRNKPAHIYIMVPNLAGLYLSGASRGNVNLKQDQALELELSGASELEGALETSSLELGMSGSSEMKLEGTTKALKADLSGASVLKAAFLQASQAHVSLSGASEAFVWVLDQLQANASGGSKLQYKGNPASTSVDQSGGARIRRSAD